LPIKLNALGQPVATYRATLSKYLGTLARNAHLAPLTFSTWKRLEDHWDDIWKTVLVFDFANLYLQLYIIFKC